MTQYDKYYGPGFLAAQGQHPPTTAIYQDNKSTIILSENGKT